MLVGLDSIGWTVILFLDCANQYSLSARINNIHASLSRVKRNSRPSLF